MTLDNKTLAWGLLILIASLLPACTKKATREESRKQLRAADAELSVHFRRFIESEGMQTMALFFSLPEAPLPMVVANTTYQNNLFNGYDLAKAAGLYQFDNEHLKWNKSSTHQDTVPLRLVFAGADGARKILLLQTYSEEVSALGMVMPTQMRARVLNDARNLLEFDYQAILKQGFPESANLFMRSGGYQLRISFKSTFTSRSTADVEVQLQFDQSEKNILNVDLEAEAELDAGQTLRYNQLNAQLEVFPIRVLLQSHHRFATGRQDFFEQWNKSSDITVFSQDGRLLGQVVAAHQTGNDRFQLVMQYNDGSAENLEQLMLVIKAILNVKIIPWKPLQSN